MTFGKIKERCVNERSCPKEAPRLFIQNAKVEYNETVYRTSTGNKYIIIAQDSVIGANSAELREKILRQVTYLSTKNTKQLARNLALAEGERTEIALNVRTDDGLTNGASNVIRLVQLNQPKKPSVIIWVEFDDEDVGKKTRQENRRLYVQGIQATWTPIKAITSQFAVGRIKPAQVVRKQFPLRPAAAKTIHRSQGDTLKLSSISIPNEQFLISTMWHLVELLPLMDYTSLTCAKIKLPLIQR